MDTNGIISAIDAEIAHLQKVKALLAEVEVPAKRKPGRPDGTTKQITRLLAPVPAKRRKMSATGRAKIAAAQKARWATYKKAKKKSTQEPASAKRKVSRKSPAKKVAPAKKTAALKKVQAGDATPTAIA